MIATLNATNPDYDFSLNARPADFRREKNLRAVMNALDATLLSLRPKKQAASAASGSAAAHWSSTPPETEPLPVGPTWSPKMWRRIDQEMTLRECSVYCYLPEDSPWTDDEDEPTLWSVDYFFFNKARKRVCYFYLRGVSLFDSGDNVPRTPLSVRSLPATDYVGGFAAEQTSSKRAAFWLGENTAAAVEGANGDAMDGVQGERVSSPDELRLLPPGTGRPGAPSVDSDESSSATSPPPVTRRMRTRSSKAREDPEQSEDMVVGGMEM